MPKPRILPAKLILLVVEDEPSIQRFLTKYLTEFGCEVVLAASGAEALAILPASAVDMVIVDETLPDMYGGELVLQIRPSAEIKSPTLFWLNEHPCYVDNIMNFLQSRGRTDLVDFYLTKPFNPDELFHFLKQFIQRSEQRHL
jgi:DNA-binding response OmpR family regulator